jgi:hypothetical protein
MLPALLAAPNLPPALVALADSTPLGVRGVAVVGGLLLLGWGSRFYRLAIAAPGAILGLVIAGRLLMGAEDTVFTVGAIAGAVVGALLTGFLEHLAVGLAGVIVGAFLVDSVGPMVLGEAAPWWGVAIGATAGLLVFPKLWKVALKVITPLLGAIAIAFAAGYPHHLLLIGGLTAVGAAFQLSRKDDD